MYDRYKDAVDRLFVLFSTARYRVFSFSLSRLSLAAARSDFEHGERS